MTGLPAAVHAMSDRGPAWQHWVDGLATTARDLLSQWDLRPDGEVTNGSASLVLPVRTADGTSAMLKIHFPDAESEHEHLVLRRWAGDGATRLLSADPPRRAVLLERLGSQTLAALPDVEACEVIAELYRRIHVPALPQLRSLATYVEQWAGYLAELPRSAQIPHRLVAQAIALSTELLNEPDRFNRVLHGDLQSAKVLAADREPWLAIAPRPMNGDPHYEVAPMLLDRWDRIAGNVRDGSRLRFGTIVDAAGLDEDRARAWVIVRLVLAATRELGRGALTDGGKLTRFVTLAKAVQD